MTELQKFDFMVICSFLKYSQITPAPATIYSSAFYKRSFMFYLRNFIILLAFTSQLFSRDVTNGTVAIFEFDAAQVKSLYKDSAPLPLLNHPTDPSKRIALLAVPYTNAPKNIILSLTGLQGTQSLHVKVVQGNYEKEVLHVEPSKVSPPKEVLARIKQEKDEAMAIYTTFNPKRFWSSPFELPMQSLVTSAYGNARIFNDTLQSYHSGTDFRASIGTPVIASNDGVVVLAKDRYYAGESIVIDHGEGIYSVYYHLSQKNVPVGATVRKGDVLGLSGMSGRVTGPHLHFGFMVQGIAVDPLDFITHINTLFHP